MLFFSFFCKIVGRVGEVSDIAQAVAYLAGESGSFITGILLPVDGGCTISAAI